MILKTRSNINIETVLCVEAISTWVPIHVSSIYISGSIVQEIDGVEFEMAHPQQVLRIQPEAFDTYVRKSIDHGLSIIGETAKNIFYYYMNSQYGVALIDLPDKIEAFHGALNGTFGAGSRIIERFVAMKLYDMLNLSFRQHKNWTLVDYVEDARRCMEDIEEKSF